MQEQLFQIALGIQEPIYITEIEFNAEHELHIYMDFRRGSKFTCPVCGAEHQDVYDTADREWRHLNFFQYKSYLHLRTPRVDCGSCGVHQITPPWAREGSGFTLLFELFVLALAKSMPILKIAETVDEHDTRIWRIVSAFVNDAYEQKDLSDLTQIGVDETSSKKGHNYVTVFADVEKGDVVYATKGKDAGTVADFAAEMHKHNAATSQIKEVTMDMSQSFISGVTTQFPDASITFDKFHVVKTLNEAVDNVRRQEQKDNPVLKKSRYVWLKNPENLTVSQQKTLGTLSKENLKTAKAYQMKLTFQDIYRDAKTQDEARLLIDKWLSWADRSRLEPMKEFASTVKSHYEGILRYFQSGLTSGIMEGINSRIQEVKRRAKGYRNINNFITMIYLVCGNLKMPQGI